MSACGDMIVPVNSYSNNPTLNIHLNSVSQSHSYNRNTPDATNYGTSETIMQKFPFRSVNQYED